VKAIEAGAQADGQNLPRIEVSGMIVVRVDGGAPVKASDRGFADASMRLFSATKIAETKPP